MVNVWSVSHLLENIGGLSEDEIKKAVPFCASACTELSNRLKDARFEDEPAVIFACAALAFYRYTLFSLAGNEDFSSFKAGDITVSRSSSASVENAVKLRDEALISASGFLTDVDFAFEAVEI